ncbi:hypothetical protein HYFRA_00011956 [Hymenoscyphus fraxineus]|uniref:Heterokaryon incompatibility domain-containing protein n=1 Tax=Hymenoscyphus fraxineus TaxID=746836 RepID=A0A9N9PUW4_9HELO|nr:hypothetical protein HYFRA_00011956 [Hymenoscyphus fraxineus]
MQSPHSFSEDRVRKVLAANTHHRDPGATSTPVEFICLGTGLSKAGDSYTRLRRKERAKDWVRKYGAVVDDPQTHISCLDEAFSAILECHFQLRQPAERLVADACQMLSRLPDTPLEFEGISQEILSSLPDEYFVPSQDLSSVRSWKHLMVVTFVSTNVIRLVLAMLMDPKTWWGPIFRGLVDTISELLQTASEDLFESENPEALFLVKSFLWSAWQRSMMLFFCYNLEVQLKSGYQWGGKNELGLRLTNIPAQRPDAEMTGYMCRWAFELLRTDRGAMGLDFRRFHTRYNAIFGDRSPRCCPTPNNIYVPCDGRAPETCMRFWGMKIEDQSAHAPSCSKSCVRLFWDEDSFKNVTGARAISIDESGTSHLRYTTASEKTLAISHVWSHGQGGRPEAETTGFNTCLHRRYCRIARSIGCDSYWMDTPCIPGLHKNQALRTQAINDINKIFTTSKVTLVVDRDLLDIDVARMSMELQESILASLLVCDWNVRAWTLLEAMRGRQNIHLLFKNDIILPFKQMLENVLREGSIDLAILFGTAQHLIPFQLPRNDAMNDAMNPFTRMLRRGYVSIEEAGCLLNHRYASRPGDGVVIWSLMCDEKASHSPEDLWRTRKNATFTSMVNTGFLMSSVPRIGDTSDCPGLNWAPARPDLQARSSVSGESEARFRSFDGGESNPGRMTEKGFKADWSMSIIKRPSLRESISNRVSSLTRPTSLTQAQNIARKYLKNDRTGALLTPLPLYRSPQADPFRYRGDANELLLAVVGSNDRGGSWHWRGVCEWDERDPLPEFHEETVLLV